MAWWNIIANGATIADLARQILVSLNKNKNPGGAAYPGDIHGLVERLNNLEKNEIRQAELIKRMAEQIQVLGNRVKTATILSVISIIVAAISIGWQLLGK